MDGTTKPQEAMIQPLPIQLETAQRQRNRHREFMASDPTENERSGQPNRKIEPSRQRPGLKT
jgi:hypothetical protein